MRAATLFTASSGCQYQTYGCREDRMPKEILCAYGVDVDAVAGWLGTYGGENSPNDISRGFFAGEVGVPRLLQLFERSGLKTTWFIPGHSVETFPQQMR